MLYVDTSVIVKLYIKEEHSLDVSSCLKENDEAIAEHESKGVFYRPQISWTDTFKYAVDLSRKHTNKTGSRALDILHVASALSIKADRFLTFDERQSKLAALSGIRIKNRVQRARF